MIPLKQPYLYEDLNFISWPEEEDLVTLDKKQNIREVYIQELNKSFFSLERYLGNLFERIQMPIFYHNSEILPAEFTKIINQIKQVDFEQYISKFENFLPIQNQQTSQQQTQEIEIQQNKLVQNEQQIKVESQQDVQKKYSQDYDYKNLLIYTLKQCYINHKKYI
ncbi:hypothetical protein PPERSA_10067 [Pseudocohnilembus persalinus]|uniref:Uncharacterized protein n=1 Tax=Pseudocohnilembus persalinus TaxID=266149 RepID=A0A0V0QJR9_PSEPJ|nr:hypothetical protein PPERSA_10067 [Pseudocohnilembus persalinus]|eukprot:KRX02450.1 hypothetical protein PPERSA_10067 [Pseudocohnilembus persalinus]